ncbi:MAG: hypothetical protein A3K19_25225 [Lentisphaerae bacterium RIFOXYB12_FULL_65_16]|nr:MAG: hypothetical protein A3K18_06650 [Lentisphaerae bacterium RIFOXYA12_64_32]OGV91124.1 MAG: hypothetical protein A3K19_25225 [Lentisphaerae bacterium RIFOXYB12_FULL_65_16]
MADQETNGDPCSLSRAELIRKTRREFGVTQARLAAALGTSAKAIQSYEQGWRNVPTRVLLQLFVLMAVHRRRQVDTVPCWEIRGCPPAERASCPSHTIGNGQFCWLVSAGSRCVPKDKDSAGSDRTDELLPCMGCAVIRRLLQTTPLGPQPNNSGKNDTLTAAAPGTPTGKTTG